MNRILSVVALVWCAIMLIELRDSPSYAQSSATNLQLPMKGATSVTGPAFHVLNGLDDEKSAAIQGSGSIGVFGESNGNDGIGVKGYGVGPGGVGVGAYGASFGVLAVVSKGYSAVVARYKQEAEDDFGSVKRGTVFTSNQGLLGTNNSGVIGVAVVDGGRGVMGVYADQPVETVADAMTTVGVNRGLLGTQQSGVQGESQSEGGFGVAGKAIGGKNAVAVYGQGGPEGFAGFFRGRVTITEHLLVPEVNANKIFSATGLTGGAKLFKIDHPLDPANRFLSHGSIESTELKNLYDGIATFDQQGAAEVVLPEWFEALNRDFRYQLTAVGGYAPVYIAREITNGRFIIAGGTPGLKVSWQVTGVRHDAYARAHPVVVEENKSQAERGKYLHPVELGFPESLAISHASGRQVAAFERTRTSATRPRPAR